MRKLYWLVIGLLGITNYHGVYGQATCETIGFENGSLSGWVLTNGSVSDIDQKTEFLNEAEGIFENGHMLTQAGDGNDPKVYDEAIPMVAPGSNYSIRIGNVNRGSRFDRIKTSFVVTPDNILLQYKFAVILQYPNHEPFQQPGFSIRVYNASNSIIACNYYQVTSTASINGFKNQGDIRYRNWTTGALDLRNFLGQTITVEVTLNGCTERRHFGYAYFDAQCIKSEITQLPYCPAYEQTITLKAPEGFASYTWSNGQKGSTIAVQPKRGEKYSVKVRPYSSLSDQCEFQFDHTLDFQDPEPPTRETATICEGDIYTIGDSTYRTAGTHLTRFHRGATQCDSVVLTTLTVKPLARYRQLKTICEGERYAIGSDMLTATGVYDTRFSRPDPLCDSIVTTELTVLKIELTITPERYIRTGDSLQMEVQAQPPGNYLYGWGSPLGLSCPQCPTTWARPGQSTQYTVTVEDADYKCQASASVLVSVGICTLFAPSAFTPNGDGSNDVFYLQGSACVELIQELVIYNRWGEVIYRIQDFPPSEPEFGWDGLYQGQRVDPDLYPYKILTRYKTGEVATQRGVVTLLR